MKYAYVCVYIYIYVAHVRAPSDLNFEGKTSWAEL